MCAISQFLFNRHIMASTTSDLHYQYIFFSGKNPDLAREIRILKNSLFYPQNFVTKEEFIPPSHEVPKIGKIIKLNLIGCSFNLEVDL